MNPAWLKAKTFGMPRYAWLALVAGGIMLGLYLRSRQSAQDAEAEAMQGDAPDDIYYDPNTLDGSYDPGLAGTGLIGPPAGSVIPVEAPLIPAGYPENFSDLTGALVDVTGVLGDFLMTQQPSPDLPQIGGGGGGGNNKGGRRGNRGNGRHTGGGAPSTRPGAHGRGRGRNRGSHEANKPGNGGRPGHPKPDKKGDKKGGKKKPRKKGHGK